MSKTKKSKLLASMLCATVVAGLYAGPVMAGTASGLAVSGSNITAEDTVIINGVTLADDGITAANGKFKVYNDGGLRIGPGGAGNAYFTINGKTGLVSAKTFEADHITAGSISAGNKNFGIDQWGNVYIGENAGDFSSGSGVNAAIKLSTDGTIAAKSITADNYNGVTLATNGTEVLVGGIDVKAMSDKTAGLERKTSGASSSTYIEGSVRINNNGGLEVLGKDGSTSTVASINRNGDLKANNATFNGNIIANGEDSVLRVGSLDGANVRAENGVLSIKNGGTTEAQLSAKGLTLGEKTLTEDNIGKVNGLFGGQHEGRPTIYAGDGSMVGGVQFSNGAITANSLTLDGLGDVGAAITELQGTVGNITDSGLPDKVGGIKRVDDFGFNTTTIEGVVSVSEAKNGTPGKFSILNYELDGFGEEVFSVNDRGYIDAKAVNPAGEIKSTFKLNDEEATILYGENGITANAAGTTISGAGTDLKLDANGATFTNASGRTVINGSSITTGAITADSLTLDGVGDVKTAIDDLKDFVGDTGTGSETLAERVQGLETNTQNIKFEESVTHINGAVSFQNGYQVTFKHGNDVISLGDLVDDIADLDNRLDVVEDKTQNITGSEPGTGEGDSTVPPTTGGETGINGDVTVGGDLTVGGSVNAGEGNFDKVNVGDKTQIGNGNISVGEDGNKTTIDNGNITVDNGESGKVEIGNGDVTVTDKDGKEHSIQGNAQDIADIREGMGVMSNRIDKLEDRIDKVGAMSAAIANLRTMGYDPTAPTEIAVGIGQYRSETGAALGLFHYPNKDFMLSLSVSTSGDEVMGGIGATWKFGRKSPEQMLAAEKEKAAKAKLAKAEAMKKAAVEAKVAAQQAKHAKMAAEKAAK